MHQCCLLDKQIGSVSSHQYAPAPRHDGTMWATREMRQIRYTLQELRGLRAISCSVDRRATICR
jgi:hypothetical protein